MFLLCAWGFVAHPNKPHPQCHPEVMELLSLHAWERGWRYQDTGGWYSQVEL